MKCSLFEIFLFGIHCSSLVLHLNLEFVFSTICAVFSWIKDRNVCFAFKF